MKDYQPVDSAAVAARLSASGVKVLGTSIFIANVLPVSPDGSVMQGSDIQQQTHAAFQNLRNTLHAAGVELKDLVRLNTYYVYKGPEDTATRYWERMTEVRLQYFPDPGPVGTAVRISGTCAPNTLIQLEAEALVQNLRDQRLRIMPEDRWDWSVPLPLSQGWRHGDYIWVGGQISADRSGRAVHQGDLVAQTTAVMRHIFSVLRDAGATPDQLLHLKVCYLHDGDQSASEARLSTIMKTIRSQSDNQNFAVTAFGVNLLYEGLLLEIDASAVANARPVTIRPTDSRNANWTAGAQGVRSGQYCHISGQSIPSNTSAPLQGTIEEALQQCLSLLGDAGGSAADVGRLTVLVADRSSAESSGGGWAVRRAVEEMWPGPAVPAVSVVLVEGLPAGAAVQIDAFAIVAER